MKMQEFMRQEVLKMRRRECAIALFLCLFLLLPVALLAQTAAPRPVDREAAGSGSRQARIINAEEMESIYARGFAAAEPYVTAARWECPGKIILWDEGDTVIGARCFSNRTTIRN
jgi:hypothetical protein